MLSLTRPACCCFRFVLAVLALAQAGCQQPGTGLQQAAPTAAFAMDEIPASFDFSQAELSLVSEHVFGGLPSTTKPFVRQAYIMAYDEDHRVPAWVAYHVRDGYMTTPPREKQFKKFRPDEEVSNPVKNADYDGLFTAAGFDRGHLAPYNICGGDRDGDGRFAIVDLNEDGKFSDNDVDENGEFVIDDEDEIQRAFEINYMSNIAPQIAHGFNRSGVWRKLEQWIQNTVVKEFDHEVWVFAGSDFSGSSETQFVGPNEDIGVPSFFYKIVIRADSAEEAETPKVLAFLFPHRAEEGEGIDEFLVSIDAIEELTGLDFFPLLPDALEVELEKTDTSTFWDAFP